MRARWEFGRSWRAVLGCAGGAGNEVRDGCMRLRPGSCKGGQGDQTKGGPKPSPAFTQALCAACPPLTPSAREAGPLETAVGEAGGGYPWDYLP